MNRMAVAKELVAISKALVAVGGSMTAEQVVETLKSEKGGDFKANWTGAWDRASADKPRLVTVNRGKGFEKAVVVDAGGGLMMYVGPYEVEAMPTADTMFLFRCDGAIFLKGL